MSQDPLALMEQRMRSLKHDTRSKLQRHMEKYPILTRDEMTAARSNGWCSDFRRSTSNKDPSSFVTKKDLSGDDYSTSVWITKSILRSLLTDVERLRPGTKGLERDLITLEARIEHEGVSFLATALVTLGKAFLKGIDEGRFFCPIGFKRPKGSKLPCIFRGIFEDVFDSATGDLVKERDSTEDVKILCQLLFFLEKVHAANDSGREAEVQGDLFFHEV